MALLTELDVVNDCLGTMGEAPLNALNEDHEMIAPARRVLKRENYSTQAMGWWFNKETITLSPDHVGNLMVPADIIALDPDNPLKSISQRGRRMYNMNARGQDPYLFTRALTVMVIRQVPFGDLPPAAQNYIAARTTLRFQSEFDGDEQKYTKLRAAERDAYIMFNAEHIRNMNINLKATSHAMGVMNPMYPYNGG